MSQLQRLKNANTRRDVATILGFELRKLAYIVYKKPAALKYQQFEIPKRSGGTRTISAPYPDLMTLQKRLANLLQDCIAEINDAKGVKSTLSHGFRRKFSIITNAAVHRNKRYVLNLDLEDFFGTINFGRVRGFFITNKNFELKEEVATLLAQIACHNNSLPQGSPCSPVISNLIGHVLDVRLAKLAYGAGCTYSRYADDLTFSTNKPSFPVILAVPDNHDKHVWAIGNELNNTISRCGFTINPSKTRMQYKLSRQEVTGLVVNSKVNTNSQYRRTARSMTDRLFKTGKYQHKVSTVDVSGTRVTVEVDGTLNQLNGILSFIDSVTLYNREKAQKQTDLKKKSLKEAYPLDSSEKVYRRFLFFKDFYASNEPVIICEGKTDNIYIRSALYSLVDSYPNLVAKNADGKTKLKIKLYRYSNTTSRLLDLSGGTGELTKFIAKYADECKEYAAEGMAQPVILLIDNDEGASPIYATLKKTAKLAADPDGTAPFYSVCNNLYIVPTPLGPMGRRTMIEDFFPNSVLEEKLGGKSFSRSNTYDKEKQYGKALFADHVVRKTRHKIDFNGFKPILDNIEAVVAAHGKKVAKLP